MSEQATIDGLARRNAELQEQLELMTENRSKALRDNEKNRDLVQALTKELDGKQVTIEVLQVKIGELMSEAHSSSS